VGGQNVYRNEAMAYICIFTPFGHGYGAAAAAANQSPIICADYQDATISIFRWMLRFGPTDFDSGLGVEVSTTLALS
jgi:hypothetical protein